MRKSEEPEETSAEPRFTRSVAQGLAMRGIAADGRSAAKSMSGYNMLLNRVRSL